MEAEEFPAGTEGEGVGERFIRDAGGEIRHRRDGGVLRRGGGAFGGEGWVILGVNITVPGTAVGGRGAGEAAVKKDVVAGIERGAVVSFGDLGLSGSQDLEQ